MQLFSDTGGLPEWVCPSAQGSYSRFLWLSLHSWTLSPVHHNVSCSFILTSDLASWSWPSDPSGWHGSNRPCSTLRTHPLPPPPPTTCHAHPWLRWGWNSVSSADQLLKQTSSILMGEPTISLITADFLKAKQMGWQNISVLRLTQPDFRSIKKCLLLSPLCVCVYMCFLEGTGGSMYVRIKEAYYYTWVKFLFYPEWFLKQSIYL